MRVIADCLSAKPISFQRLVKIAGRVQLIAVKALALEFDRLLGIIARRVEIHGADISRNFLAAVPEQLIQRQIGDQAGDVPKRDIERSIGINGRMMPVALVAAEFVPMFLTGEGIFPRKKGLIDCAAIEPAISAPMPANPMLTPSMPASVFMVIMRKLSSER